MEVRNKAIKYRLYPTEEQATLFLKTFGCCRKVYNLMLSAKIESYKLTGKFITVTPAIYKNDYPYLKEVDSLALLNAELNLQTEDTLTRRISEKTDFLNSNQQNTREEHIPQTIKMVLSLLLIILLSYLRLEE